MDTKPLHRFGNDYSPVTELLIVVAVGVGLAALAVAVVVAAVGLGSFLLLSGLDLFGGRP